MPEPSAWAVERTEAIRCTHPARLAYACDECVMLALDAARTEEREACAKIMCFDCKLGDPVEVDGWGALRHTKAMEASPGGDGVIRGAICRAAAIRAQEGA